MSHERLLQSVVSVLIMAGYNVSERCGMRPRSFDLIARKGDNLLIIKIVPHIDSVGEESAHDLAVIARHLNAKPFIIGEKARDFELERGAVYLRYGIIATSVTTLYDFFVDEVPPLVYAQPGGLYVNINGGKLRDVRERHNMSLGDLAGSLGVSRRTISKYESGMSTTLDIAIKLEEIFDTAIVEAINLLSHSHVSDFEDDSHSESIKKDGSNIPQDFERMGMQTHTMQRAPFEALCIYEEKTILTGYGTAQKTLRRAALIGNISDITSSKAVCVLTDYKKRKKVGKTLIIGEEELSTLNEGSELIELIDE
ncbi:transcriptional regulator [Methanomicrobium antiquum]|uniref:Putative HTH-type transcriptional regulatory protein L1994_10585 n=1 Tax=Methanomicrobium antiquum TaxID=487686 RepID=A0AAF0FRC2_9EURY|nr:transcriptional regulator [Methanomicrobium antiquum]MDD3977790.1 transcriptional regulator [Methanomicrobium sp.]WFN36571.1 transcriptional regulator [Methanomicrobium antiquum]